MRRAAVLGIGVGLLLLAPASATVPKPDFIKQADAVCASFEPRIDAAVQNITYSYGFQNLARNVEHAMRLGKHLIDSVQSVGSPDHGRARLARWYRLWHKWRAVFLDAADEARDRDIDGVKADIQRSKPIAHAKKHAARTFGFRVCR